MKEKAHIGILTIQNDLHALAIKKYFENHEDIICNIIETNSICSQSSLSWSNINNKDFICTVTNYEGKKINVNELDIIWWRRFNPPQILPSYVADSRHIDLINNDCKTSLLGLLLNNFSGTWLNEPNITTLAENKLIQLKAAQDAGFIVPRTIVSNEPAIIRQFCAMLKYEVVVKPVKGSLGLPLFTQKVTEEHLKSDESLSLSPAIYQECISGNKHIRAHCFGDAVYAVLIESEQLDWRQNLDIPFNIFELDENTKMCLRQVLKILKLKMGIFDLKFNEEGKIVWLEVNPQGQFLFTEGLSGFDLTSAFAEFIYREAKQAVQRKIQDLHTKVVC